jgi:hypothetical protein
MAAITIVSPNCTTAAPAACFAMRPDSIVRGRPANVRSNFCMISNTLVWKKNAREPVVEGARAKLLWPRV